jgi:hypothetical protein
MNSVIATNFKSLFLAHQQPALTSFLVFQNFDITKTTLLPIVLAYFSTINVFRDEDEQLGPPFHVQSRGK